MMNNSMSNNAFDVAPLLFGWLDFSVFGLVLLASAGVGVYYGFFNKQQTKLEYLLGGNHISGVTVMGVPSEIYNYGSLYILVCVSCILVVIVMHYVYLPVFFEFQLTSTYEYLEWRFSRSVRVMASLLYTIAMLLYVPIVVYVPALAFSQVSGIRVHAITPAVCIICIFYTMLGGFRAVVWSDVIQVVVMVGSGVAIMLMGAHKVGGFGSVWQTGKDGGRINIFEMDPNPTTRNTFWTVLTGTFFLWSANSVWQGTMQKLLSVPSMYSARKMDPNPLVRSSFWTVIIGTTFLRTANMVNQGSVQKFLSLPKRSKVAVMLVYYCLGIIIMKFLSVSTGLIIYTAYHNCDPIKSGAVKRADQLLPYFVMDIAGSIPGFPGLFIAGVFSASLSSMASGLNCLAATIFEDFVRPWLRSDEDERTGNYIMKTIVFVVGVICVFLVVIVEKLGGVLEISYSAQGMTCGALLGLFSLGVFFPWANAKGALWGSVSSLLLVGWIVSGAQNAIATGQLKHTKLSSSIAGCKFNVSTIMNATLESCPDDTDEVFVLYRISYWYYAVIGTLTVIIVGMTVSFLTGLQDPNNINVTLIAPFLRNIIKRKQVSEEVVELTSKEQNTYISGVTLMGVPSEIYMFGTLYVLMCFANIIVALLMDYIYLPVFFELQLTSTYEYLELRFNKKVRIMSSVLFTMYVVLFIPVVGGIKAVVWTDFLQSFIMLGACIVVIVLGVLKAGGLYTVFQRSNDGGRLIIFEMDPSLTARNTFWTVLIGTTVMWMGLSVNQGALQKYLSLPSIRSARKALIIYCIGLIMMKGMSIFTGLIVYATYYDCDPIQTQAVKRVDQLLPYFVMDTVGNIPGLPGLFIAGIFSAALSTLSSCLNCLSATVFEDFVQPLIKAKDGDRKANYIMKGIVVVLGYSTQGVTLGTLLGLFTLGVLFPWANAKGALWGSIVSLTLVSWIVFGAQKAIATGKLTHKKLPTSIEGCDFNITSFITTTTTYFTGFEDCKDKNPALFAPFLRKYVTAREEVPVQMITRSKEKNMNGMNC
ncbi:hypothetical protein C0J52_02935 [Blattella germanica]|nr:hypothetical protein C0J52_02935 [Blattella germanica]